jgi:hypothetical protein
MEITITQSELVENLKTYFSNEFTESLAATELDEDEKQANVVLSKKRILKDAENIAELVFKASSK